MRAASQRQPLPRSPSWVCFLHCSLPGVWHMTGAPEAPVTRAQEQSLLIVCDKHHESRMCCHTQVLGQHQCCPKVQLRSDGVPWTVFPPNERVHAYSVRACFSVLTLKNTRSYCSGTDSPTANWRSRPRALFMRQSCYNCSHHCLTS